MPNLVRGACKKEEEKRVPNLDKAPRLSIRIVIWILPSDTVFDNSTKISSTNSETTMLSNPIW